MWRASSPSSGCRPHRATTAACSRCSARSGPNACAPPVHHAILSEDVVTVAGMATAEDRVGMLEMRVKTLETWAGPGQTEALAEGQRKIRADLAKIQKTQDRHSRLLGRLTSDVDILKGDVAGRVRTRPFRALQIQDCLVHRCTAPRRAGWGIGGAHGGPDQDTPHELVILLYVILRLRTRTGVPVPRGLGCPYCRVPSTGAAG